MMSYLLDLAPRLFQGFFTSVLVFSLTLIVSMPLGMVGALLYQSKLTFIKGLIKLYTWIIRGTPLLLQLYIMFYALPLAFPIQIRDMRLGYAIAVFIINYTAYFIEIYKGGLSQIPQGQWDASKLLGINTFNTLKHIIIPQVIRNTLFVNANEAITLVKDTSLLAAVAVPEVLMIAKESLSRDSRVDALVAAGLGYLMFTFIVVKGVDRISKTLRVEVKL